MEHPGAIINLFLTQLNMKSTELAKRLNVSPSTVSRIANQKSDVTADMAIRLSIVVGGSPEDWLMMQMRYDLWKAQQEFENPPRGHHACLDAPIKLIEESQLKLNEESQRRLLGQT